MSTSPSGIFALGCGPPEVRACPVVGVEPLIFGLAERWLPFVGNYRTFLLQTGSFPVFEPMFAD
jgi:hypothetical protein